ncbi:MAG: hypothetical protein HQL29_02195 [Candidatus Omnitrophica bacterium]|nr:hypothetical protein [Candidatus Omnitrophota bacterium]
MKKLLFLFCGMAVLSLLMSGCGETCNGIIKDSKRIGTGIKTVFIRE